MDVGYERLFSITCLHLYFAEEPPVCRNLMLRPTRACAQALYNHKLLFRATPGGGVVFYEQQSKSILQSLRESLSLAFTLRCTDPYFINYTDLSLDINKSDPGDPLTPTNAVYYFTNLTKTPNERSLFGKTRSLLHPKAQVKTQDRLVVKPPVFTLPLPADTDVKIVDQTRKTVWDVKTAVAVAQPYRTPGTTIIEPGNLILTGGASPAGATGTPAPLAVDMRGHPPGQYHLFVDGQAEDAFYLSDLVPSAVWGLVEIVVDGPASALPIIVVDGSGPALPITEAYRPVQPGGAITPRDFTIYFKNRKTLWRYYISTPAPDVGETEPEKAGIPGTVSKNGENVGTSVSGKVTKQRQEADGKMIPVNRPIHFKEVQPREAETIPFANGQKALVFESKTEIPLLQRPADSHHFSFKDDGSSYFLPYASSNLVKPFPLDEAAPDGPKKVVSEIYVYL